MAVSCVFFIMNIVFPVSSLYFQSNSYCQLFISKYTDKILVVSVLQYSDLIQKNSMKTFGKKNAWVIMFNFFKIFASETLMQLV